jgi:hypothetical protein
MPELEREVQPNPVVLQEVPAMHMPETPKSAKRIKEKDAVVIKVFLMCATVDGHPANGDNWLYVKFPLIAKCGHCGGATKVEAVTLLGVRTINHRTISPSIASLLPGSGFNTSVPRTSASLEMASSTTFNTDILNYSEVADGLYIRILSPIDRVTAKVIIEGLQKTCFKVIDVLCHPMELSATISYAATKKAKDTV